MSNFDRQIQEIENKVNGNTKQSTAPKASRPKYSSDRTQQQVNDLHQQSTEGLSGLVQSSAQQEASSLQRVDASLSNFEEGMSDRLADRISQVGARIAALTVKKLQQRQQQATPIDSCMDVEDLLMSIDVPNLALPSFGGGIDALRSTKSS